MTSRHDWRTTPEHNKKTPGPGQCGENRAPPVREPICYGQGTPAVIYLIIHDSLDCPFYVHMRFIDIIGNEDVLQWQSAGPW